MVIGLQGVEINKSSDEGSDRDLGASRIGSETSVMEDCVPILGSLKYHKMAL